MTTRQRPSKVRVGDRVRVPMGGNVVKGEVVEDRGNLAVGGRRLWRIWLSELGEEFMVELAEDEFERVPTRPRRVSRRT